MFDVEKIRQDFPMLTNRTMSNQPLIYFDNAATTFKPYSVIKTVSDYYLYQSANVHRGDYDLSYQVSDAYEKARQTVADFINAQPKEVVFTSGASAALNLVAYGWGQKFLKPNDVILSTEAEHASNILPWFKAAEVTQATFEFIPLNEDGEITIENFRKSMHSRVKVVTLAHITNVLGFVAPIKEITKIAHEYGAIVVVDAAQSVPHIATDVRDWDVDFLAFSAHKMIGPTGIGALFGKYHLLQETDPFMLGGGSNARFDICGNIQLKNPPYKFEVGTPAIEAVLGFKAAIDYLQSVGMEHIESYEKELRAYLIDNIKDMKHIQIYNVSAPTGIVTFNVHGIFAQDVAAYMNAFGIAVRAGNHCAKILLDMLKVSDTVRASVYFYNTYQEVDHFVQVLQDVTLEKCVDLLF